MHKILFGLVAFSIFSANTQGAPLERDERDVLRSAHVFHIMGPSQSALEPIRAQLNGSAADQLLGDFRRLARAQSSDVGSAATGGDLGVIAEGTMDEKFEAAVFSQQPMRVSSPQQSAMGWP